MQRKAGWAIGLVLLIAQFASAQTNAPPAQERLPSAPSRQPEALTSDDRALVPIEEVRRSAGFYVGADYLLWWIHRGPSPALLTTAPDNGKNAKGLTGGILGEPGTTALFTSDNLDYHTTSGMRLSAGISLDS